MAKSSDPDSLIREVKFYVQGENCRALQRVVNELKIEAKARPILYPAFRAARKALLELMIEAKPI
jgi:hypothetical protein